MVKPGAVVWFTGVPAAGKSTIATVVEQMLQERGLLVENLDADDVRQNLSPNLGFTPEARDENTKRLAWMGKVLSRNGVHVMIAAVAPLQAYRDRAREWCTNFVEVFVDCPLEVCQERDPKGLYAKAARGEINDIAGMHQPYEKPVNPEVSLDTTAHDIEECARQVVSKLEELKYI